MMLVLLCRFYQPLMLSSSHNLSVLCIIKILWVKQGRAQKPAGKKFALIIL